MSEDTPPDTGATASSRGGPSRSVGAPERRERLAALGRDARGCTRCPQLVAGRTQVVFGAGDPDADLMFVTEAPGVREDAGGFPLAGAPGRLLDELLASIGLSREEVYVVHVLACRPPGNRDPAPAELGRCRPYLEEQVALVEPRVVCTLGDFTTKLLRPGSPGITQLHGQPEIVEIGTRAVRLLPLFHPAAALYTRALRDALEADVARLPELVARPAPAQPTVVDADQAPGHQDLETEVPGDGGVSDAAERGARDPEPVTVSESPASPAEPDRPDEQLGLF